MNEKNARDGIKDANQSMSLNGARMHVNSFPPEHEAVEVSVSFDMLVRNKIMKARIGKRNSRLTEFV